MPFEPLQTQTAPAAGRFVPMNQDNVYRAETGKVITAPMGLEGKELEFLDDTQNNLRKPEEFMGFVDLKQATLDVLDYPAALAKGAGFSAVNSYAMLNAGTMRQVGEARKEVFENKPFAEMNDTEKLDAINRANTPALATFLFGSIRDKELQTGWIRRLFVPKEKGMAQAEGLVQASIKMQEDAQSFARKMDFEREEGAKGFLFDVGSVTTTIGASIGLSVVTKNPVAAGALFGDLQKNTIYLEAQEKGWDNLDADEKSGLAGLLEGGLEFVGVSYFLKAAEMSKPIARIGFQAFEEGVQELTQTGAEELVTQLSGLREKDLKGGVQRMFYSMLLGFLGGGTVATAVHIGEQKAKEEGIPPEVAAAMAPKIETAMPRIEQELGTIIVDQASPMKASPEAEAKTQKIVTQFVSGHDVDISDLPEAEQDLLNKVRERAQKKLAKVNEKVRDTRIKELEKQVSSLQDKIDIAEDPKVLKALNADLRKVNNELDDLIVDEQEVGKNKLAASRADIDRLTKVRDAMKSAAEGFRTGKVASQRSIRAVQNRLASALDETGLQAGDKAKFIKTIKNIQTPEQLESAADNINERIDELLEAQKRRETIAAIKKTVRKVRKSNVIAVDFAKQIDSLFREIDTSRRTEGTLNSLQKTLDFMKTNPGAQMPGNVLKKLELLNKKRLEDIDTKELEDIHREMTALVKQGKTKLALLNAKKERLRKGRLEQLAKESVPLSDRPVKRAPIGERLSIMERIRNKYIETLNREKRLSVALNPMDVFFDMLDGNKAYKGANHRIFKQTIDKAFSAYLNLKEGATRDVKKLSDKLGLDEKNFEKIGAYAAAQQEGGVEKLKEAGITEGEIQSLELNDAEMQMYRLMRQKLDEMLPAIKEVMRVVYNKDVESVKDYFPFMTDHDAMKDFEIQDQFGDDVPQVGKKRNVAKGFTEKRTLGKQKIRIDAMGVFLRHVDNAAYLVEMGQSIRELGAVAVSKEYGEAVGDIGQEMVVEWIDLLARKGSTPGRVEAIDALRRNTGFAVLGFKLSSILIQPTALADGAALVGGGYVARGTADIAVSPEWRQFLKDNFPEIRERGGDDPAYLDMGGDGVVGSVREAGFWALKNIDLLTASSVAAGAYTKSVEERGGTVDLSNPDPQAIAEAQLLMRRTQSSVFAKDLAPVLTQGALTGNVSLDKLIFQFQSFMLNRFSLIRHDLWALGVRGGNTKRALNVATWLILANAAEIGIRRLSKEMIASLVALLTGDDRDIDPWGDTIQKEAVTTALGNVPFVSQGVDAMGYGSVPVPSLSLIGQITNEMKYAAQSKKPETKQKHIVNAAILAVGTAAGVPGTLQAEQIHNKATKTAKKKSGVSTP